MKRAVLSNGLNVLVAALQVARLFCHVLFGEKTPLSYEQEPEMPDVLPVAVSNPKFCVVGCIL